MPKHDSFSGSSLKRIFCALFFVLACAPSSFAAQNDALRKAVEKTAASVSIRNAQWGVSVKYADTGTMLAEYNPRQNLIPASSLKLLVTAAALNILGEDYRFRTRLFYDGKISSDGTLKGNVYIRGGGDPALGSDRVKGSMPMEQVFSSWAGKLRQKGIKKIKGSIVADNLLYSGTPIPGSWSLEDTGNYYAAPADALSINDNLYTLYLRPGRKAGDDAAVLRTEPEIPGLKFVNLMKTGPRGSGDKGYIFCSPGQYTATLRGTVPAGPAEFAIKGAIPEPA
ncbi:MAG: D-alanyl-D-alanine carboxypeptidase/D-alanyl-D-alanine-endopeptidase, partial [bacterium]